MSWWVNLGYPSFGEGKGGFPRTGEVIKHYREMKKDDEGHGWTQIRFARHLKISGKAAGDIENKDVGLDFDRRRHLCALFAIPPVLLGIRTLEEVLAMVEQEQAKQEASVAHPSSASWWVKLDYPDFAKGPDGFPHPGQVVKHYRKQKMDKKGKPWSQRLLALGLGITEQAVRDMESRGSGMDWDRRQFLSEWLNIPPLLLGIRTIEEICKLGEKNGKEIVEPANRPLVSNATTTSGKLGIDVEEYTSLLNCYWTTFISVPTPSSMLNVSLNMDALYRELPHARDQKPIQELLCRYHDFVANVLRDRQEYDEAIEQCNKALRFAQQLHSDELKALALYEWGYTLWQADRLDEALQKFEDARHYERSLPANLRGVLLLDTGRTRAQAAKTADVRRDAMALVDSVGNMIRNNHEEDDPYFLNLNLDRYHLTRSATLIAIERNRDALDELKLVKADPAYLRRQACHEIYQAQAHAHLGEYERVVELVESALEVALSIGSEILIARVEKLHRLLKESPYKDSPHVARLDYLLKKKSSKK